MILCPIHGRSPFVQKNDKLYVFFLKDLQQSVKSTTFLVEGLDLIRHFTCSEEILDWAIPDMTYEHFSENFKKISSAQTVCGVCFEEYLAKHGIDAEEVSIKVIG